MPGNEEDGIIVKTFMETLWNNRKLLVVVIIAILVQVFTFAWMANSYGCSALVITYQICQFLALLLVTSSFVLIINKKSKLAIACTAASAFVVMIGYLLVGYLLYLIYLNYRDTYFDDYSFFGWCLPVISLSILSILPQVMLLVFLLKKAKNAQLWAWVAVLLSLLPSLIYLLLDGNLSILTLCSNISLAFLYYFGYTSTDTTQQTGILEKIKVHLSDARNHTKGVNGMNKMYTNIGGKIKMLAKILCVLLSIIFVVYGICVFATFYQMRGMGILIMIGGPLLSWVSSFFAYGFGELIEKTTVIAEAAAKADAKKDTVE